MSLPRRSESPAVEPPDTLHRLFEDAFNRGDVDAIVALYERDGALVRPDGVVRGHAALADAFRAVLVRLPQITLRTLAVHRVGELAMLHGAWTVREIGDDGREVRREGWNTETARLQADGRWLFVIDNPSVPVRS